MLIMGNFIFGIIFGVAGFYLLKEAYYINKQILFVGWAERKWGPGSGTSFYQFFGIGLMVFALFVAIGRIDVYNAAFGSGPREAQPELQTKINNKNTQQSAVPKINKGGQIAN
jgi:hypothetical protein